MNDYGKVSVILPVYNGEKYIQETIKSILRSVYQNIEVLVVDDGSTDNSLMYCRQLQEQDSRIIVYSKENGGTVSARNYGIAKASGKYLCFCDQDDIVDSECYSKQTERMEQDGSELCMCSVGRSIDGKYSAFELSEDACYDNEHILEELLYPLLFNGFAPPLKMGKSNRYPHIWSYAHKYIENLAEKQQFCFEDLYHSIAGRIRDQETLRLLKSAIFCKQYLEAIHNLTSSEIRKTRKTIRQYYENTIYGRNFDECIAAAKYVKKGKIKPQVLLKILSGHHTMASYYAEIVLDWILLFTLRSQTLTRLERMLKGIKG